MSVVVGEIVDMDEIHNSETFLGIRYYWKMLDGTFVHMSFHFLKPCDKHISKF
jgi:hypothetical protein